MRHCLHAISPCQRQARLLKRAMQKNPDALVLFSGGLDSILAARLLMSQGLDVLCLHFTSPFFGKPRAAPGWQKKYGLRIKAMDIAAPFAQMLVSWPENGLGKTLNPCVDCKILMLRQAKNLMDELGAKFVATGEVAGQRPMSQRVDTMNLIAKRCGLGDRLVRPLCAPLLNETAPEKEGLLIREHFPKICGRGRNMQLEMAKSMGIEDIPGPGGGCKLTERENARRYWPLIQKYMANPGNDMAQLVNDLQLTNYGRVLFHKFSDAWICIGRNQQDNADILACAKPDDAILKLPFPGPLALLRNAGDDAIIKEACQLLAGYSARARETGREIAVQATCKYSAKAFSILADSPKDWFLPDWPQVHEEIKTERKQRMKPCAAEIASGRIKENLERFP